MKNTVAINTQVLSPFDTLKHRIVNEEANGVVGKHVSLVFLQKFYFETRAIDQMSMHAVAVKGYSILTIESHIHQSQAISNKGIPSHTQPSDSQPTYQAIPIYSHINHHYRNP